MCTFFVTGIDENSEQFSNTTHETVYLIVFLHSVFVIGKEFNHSVIEFEKLFFFCVIEIGLVFTFSVWEDLFFSGRGGGWRLPYIKLRNRLFALHPIY